MADTKFKKISALPGRAAAHIDNRAMIALATAAFAGGAALVAWALGRRGERAANAMFPAETDAPGANGDPAPDLAADAPRPGAGDRAPAAFRPDPTAAVPDAERAAMAPATLPNPAAPADRG